MKADFQRRIQRYGWDSASTYYEDSWRTQLKPAQDRLLEMADLQPGEHVLDIACGTGLITFPAARSVQPEGIVTGTDLSERMVEKCRELAEAHGINNVLFDWMDAEELGLPDQLFDVVLCGLGLMYFPDPTKALKEMLRVLKPGGRAVAAVWGARQNCGWAEIFPIVEKRVTSDVCPLFFQLGTGNSFGQHFEMAGFEQVEVNQIRTYLHYDEAETACVAVFAGGPVALAYKRFDESVRKEAHKEYLDSIQPYKLGDGYDIPGEFVIARGVKVSN